MDLLRGQTAQDGPATIHPPRKFGYELFFDGKLVSGPETPFWSFDEARANCDGNKKDKPQIRIECRYFGKRFGP
jgi:hypothetical protein